MSIILKSDHQRIVRKIKKRAMIIHLVGILITLSFMFVPLVCKIERDLMTEAYRVAKAEFDSVLARQELMLLLRSKPLTIGQTLDIADIIISQQQVPIPLVLAVISQESDFRPEAISEKGARGLMQVMPLVFRTYIHSPTLNHQRQMHDPVTNVRTGISYLSDMKEKYGNWKKALRVYYAGPQNAENKTYDWYASAVLKKAAHYEKIRRE